MKCEQLYGIITVDDTEIISLPINTSVKSLGIISTPINEWEAQFSLMEQKMEDAVTKITTTSVLLLEVYTFFYNYFIKSVFFSVGVIKLTVKQIDELCKIFKVTLLKKLGYSENFPRFFIYIYIKAMGLGFMRPIIILDQLKL